MEPIDDPKLSRLLKEWQAANAPASLDRRVLHDRPRSWWRFLLSGSIRVPVPVGVALVAVLGLMAFGLLRPPQPAAPKNPVNLVDFRPADDPNVRIIRGIYEPR